MYLCCVCAYFVIAACHGVYVLKYRCESFNSSVRFQNIYGNKQAPSRDIANFLAIVEYLRFICGGGKYNSNERLVI